MQLIIYFSRLRFLLHKRQDFQQLLLIASLKSRRIVENKSWVTLKCERPMDVMYPSLLKASGKLVDKNSEWITAEVGSS